MNPNCLPVALITGAGSGIGRAIALEFSARGAFCILVGRDQNKLRAVLAEISDAGCVLPLDVSLSDCEFVLREYLGKNPQLSAHLRWLILNAGIYRPRSTMDSDSVNWTEHFAVNLFGPVAVAKACVPYLMSNQGSILGISSTLGSRPTANTAAYSASKAAFNNWLQSLAQELGPKQVRVNVLAPGIVDTPIHGFHSLQDKTQAIASMAHLQPLGRIGAPEDIAPMAWMLCSDQSAWVTGAIVNVDGGISLA